MGKPIARCEKTVVRSSVWLLHCKQQCGPWLQGMVYVLVRLAVPCCATQGIRLHSEVHVYSWPTGNGLYRNVL